MRPIALALTILTGFTGLVYEVTWQKSLAVLLGSHSEATAAVLGIFLGGLSVGYGLFGRVTSRRVQRAQERGSPPRLLLLYGLVEAGIGLHAFAFPSLFQGVQALSLGLPDLDDGLAFGIDVALTALLIGPPTVLMGGTIPILTQALSRDVEDSTRIHAAVYAFNTAGAFVGALAGGFFLIPWLGINGVLLAMGTVNLGAGAVFSVLGRHPRWMPPASPSPPRSARVAPSFALYASTALLLGFAMMTTQTSLIRLGGLSQGASHFTFAMVVAAFVLCLALGSFVVSAMPRIPRPALPISLWGLAALLALLHLELHDAPYYAHLLRTQFEGGDADFTLFYAASFGALLAVLFLPVGIAGASLPLLFHHLRREVGDLGATAGRLYSWNTVGNLLGSLLGGYVLLIWLDLHQVFRIGVAAIGIAAALLTARLLAARHWQLGLLISLPVLVATLLPSWDPTRLASGLFRVREAQTLTGHDPDVGFRLMERQTPILFYTDDPVTSVAVKAHSLGGGANNHRALFTNGKPDGSTGRDRPTMVLAGLLPCLMATACEKSFVIGLGTGMTAGELAQLQSMREVVVAEISRGVVEAAPLFDFASHGASDHPKIDIHRSDAYRALLRSEDRYDVIVSEPSNPWVTGVEMLYSLEFLTAARARLREGGIYVQWLHLYENDAATVELVLRTYARVFDRIAVWYTLGPDILLLGFAGDGEGEALNRMVERFAEPEFRAGLGRAGISSLPELLVHELWPPGAVEQLQLQGPIHTLGHPRLAYSAARAFFWGRRARLPPIGSLAGFLDGRSLLERLRRRDPGVVGPSQAKDMVEDLCATADPRCAVGLAWWAAQFGESPARRELLRQLRSGVQAESVDAETLHALELLFGARPPKNRTFSPEEAMRITQLFEAYYLGSLPFDRRALTHVWDHCRDSGTRCEVERRAVEDRIGDL